MHRVLIWKVRRQFILTSYGYSWIFIWNSSYRNVSGTWVELAFEQIGASVMLGALLGGSAGFYSGLSSTTLACQSGHLT